MADYKITWSGRYGQGSKSVATAIMASTWIDEFRDKGADAIVIERDRKPISEADLLELIKSETAEFLALKSAEAGKT